MGVGNCSHSLSFKQLSTTMKKYFLPLITCMLLSCGDGSETTTPEAVDQGKDRALVLAHYADNIVIPAYANFKVKFDIMESKSVAFTTKPDLATLTEFRAAWVDAYTEWQKVELFDFGPAEKETIRSFYNIYPANVNNILENIENPSANLEVPASYANQGFPALDYLLNGVGATDAQILAFYTANSAQGQKRLAYITRLTDRMNLLLTKVTTDWNGTYRDTFVSKTGLDIGSSTSLMINGLVLHYERFIRSGKFGIPSGAMLNGVVSPEKVEAFYKKDLSKTLALTAHQAYVDYFNGKNFKTGAEGPSIKTYMDELKAKDAVSGKMLSELINAQFEVSKTKINALKPNFYEEVKTNNTAMQAVYTEMQNVIKMLKVDMTSAMSITITYTDNDGD